MRQSVLVGLCEGPALSIVNRIEDGIEGFESWRLLWKRYRPQSRETATAMFVKLLKWTFDPKDFITSFNKFENEIRKYDSEQPRPCPDEVKIGIILSKTTGVFREHLLLNMDVETPYTKIRDVIIKYYATDKLFESLRSNSYQGPQPMDIGAIWKKIKSKGKSKGKSTGVR